MGSPEVPPAPVPCPVSPDADFVTTPPPPTEDQIKAFHAAFPVAIQTPPLGPLLDLFGEAEYAHALAVLSDLELIHPPRHPPQALQYNPDNPHNPTEPGAEKWPVIGL